MNNAPRSIPWSEPRPPTTTPVSSRIESEIGNVSGLTKAIEIASSEPATPAYAAAIPKASVLYQARLTPDETAAIGASRTARKARPSRPRSISQAAPNMTAATAQIRYESHAFVLTPPRSEEHTSELLS